MVDIGTLGGEGPYPGASSSIALDINDSGQVAGWSYTGDGFTHGFIYNDGVIHDLETLGGDNSQAFGINNSGDAVGHSLIAGNSYYKAFHYTQGIMLDLSTLVPVGSSWDYLSAANDINDKGQIVGWGYISGESHAFLLTPVDFVDYILFGWDYPHGLVTIDPKTSDYWLTFASDRQFEAMAYNPVDKILYAIENLNGNNLLVSIDYSNENISDIGYVLGFTEITSMTYDRTTDTLYAIY